MSPTKIIKALSKACDDREISNALETAYFRLESCTTVSIQGGLRDGNVVFARAHPPLPGDDGLRPVLVTTYPSDCTVALKKIGLTPVSYFRWHSPKHPGAEDQYFVDWKEMGPSAFAKHLWCFFHPRAVEVTADDVPGGFARNNCAWALEEGLEAIGASRKDDSFKRVLVYLAENWGRALDKTNQFDVHVCSGIDAFDVYQDERYAPGSCMNGDPQTAFYQHNAPADCDRSGYDPYAGSHEHDGVVVLAVHDKLTDEPVGRALLWSGSVLDNDGDPGERRKCLDRVYPSDNGPHTVALRQLAVKHGWLYKLQDSYTSQTLVDGRVVREATERGVAVDVTDPGKDAFLKRTFVVDVEGCDEGWPYLDTMWYLTSEALFEGADAHDLVAEPVRLWSDEPPKDLDYAVARSTDSEICVKRIVVRCETCGEPVEHTRYAYLDCTAEASGDATRIRACDGCLDTPLVECYEDRIGYVLVPEDRVVRVHGQDRAPWCVKRSALTGEMLKRGFETQLHTGHYGPGVYAHETEVAYAEWPESGYVLTRDARQVTLDDDVRRHINRRFESQRYSDTPHSYPPLRTGDRMWPHMRYCSFRVHESVYPTVEGWVERARAEMTADPETAQTALSF